MRSALVSRPAIIQTSKKVQAKRGEWSFLSNQRTFFDNIGKELGISKPEDWYKIQAKQLESFGGRALLLEYYHGNLYHALQAVYPDVGWLPWKFSGGVPRGYWDDTFKQREFFDWAGSQLGIENHEDWYQIPLKQVIDLPGGHAVLKKYANSLVYALERVYPEFKWQPWKSKFGVPTGYWDNEANIRKFLDFAMSYYDIKRLDDLNSIRTKEFNEIGGGFLVSKHGGLVKFLAKYFPEYQPSWDIKSKGQERLYRVIKSLFPGTEVVLNFRTPSLSSNGARELDLYLPEFKLGIEYQGEYHFQFSFLQGSPEDVQKRDSDKKALCSELGITLIEIPFWWNGQKAPILSTIHKYRPDIVSVPQRGVPALSVTEVPKSFTTSTQKRYKKQMINLEGKDLKNEDMWEQIHPGIPYSLHYGSRSKCHFCGDPFSREDIRVQANGIFIAMDTRPYKVKYSFCCKRECINKVPAAAAATGTRVLFPPFHHRIAVNKQQITPEVEAKLKDIENVEWVVS